ncbi:hypothetical protein V8C43DRAFT_290068 [Trichoderma afarasin]
MRCEISKYWNSPPWPWRYGAMNRVLAAPLIAFRSPKRRTCARVVRKSDHDWPSVARDVLNWMGVDVMPSC